MKHLSNSLVVPAIILLAGCISASAQATQPQADKAASDSSDNGKPVPEKRTVGGVADISMDPITFRINTPDLFDPLLSDLNWPEAVEERRLAYMALLDPDGSYRLFPKSAETVRKEEEAALAATKPKTREEKQALQTPEENAKDDEAMRSLLEFTIDPDSDPIKTGPGPIPAAADNN